MFTFDFCSLLSVIRKQELKQCKYYVVSSALMTGFQTEYHFSKVILRGGHLEPKLLKRIIKGNCSRAIDKPQITQAIHGINL